MAPTVSAVITAYNTVHLLPRAIDSVLSQTHPVDEIIVVDDASPNPALAVLGPYKDKIQFVRREVNGGPATARNNGIRAARGEWIAFLDHDDIWLPGKIACQLKVAEAYPNAALIYGDALQRTPDGKILPNLHADKHPLSGHILDGLIDEFFVVTSTFLAKKKALVQIGCFDKAATGVEDQYLCMQLSLRGQEIRLAPEPLLIYERQPTSLSRNAVKMLQVHSVVWNRLLVADLTSEQKTRVRRRLFEIHFDLAYRLRQEDGPASIRHAYTSARHRPFHLTAWRLLVANILLGLTSQNRRQSEATK